MPLRILHTADWQIGMKARHVGAGGERVREARLAAARRVMEAARSAAVDAVILAGDTFEDSGVPREMVQRVVDILRTSPVPVFVLPGNHDPLVPGGVFEHPAWNDAAPHVRVFRDTTPVEIGGALLLPCPLRTKTSSDDPTDALPDFEGSVAGNGDARMRIGVAHGSLLGAGAPDADIADDFPIDRAVVARKRLDYLALGHWHVPSTHEVSGTPRVAYSGAHEPTKFGERSEDGARESGQCLVISIDAPGVTPRIEPVRTAVLTWRQAVRRIESAADLEALRREIDQEPAGSRASGLFDLRLEGAVSAPERRALDDLGVLARERFLHVRIDTSGVALRPGDDAETARWIASLPAGAPAAAARRLLEAAAAPGPDAAVARRALEILHSVTAGGAS